MLTQELDAGVVEGVRHDWTRDEIEALHDLPLMELVYRAATVHRRHHDAGEVQVCRLVSVKTGGCPEDCSYCSQSSRYDTGVGSESLMDMDSVKRIAESAKRSGISRVCLGAAWREVRDGESFERVLGMVREVTGMGLEVCCTLGMLTGEQARRLEEAGLYAYNHNLDTSRDHYETIITTRSYDDRLKTLENVRSTKVTVCCGGILGMGEAKEDRIALLQTLSSLRPHPESVPINVLSQVPGTPLAGQEQVPFSEVLRAVATARLVMPRAVIRLSAGRSRLSETEQGFCFMAGANSIFSSDEGRMLTDAVPSPDYDMDRVLLDGWGLRMREPFKASRAEAELRGEG
ncbi:MAG: biotin synthase BioB [Verrucomicrobiota bacterium]